MLRRSPRRAGVEARRRILSPWLGLTESRSSPNLSLDEEEGLDHYMGYLEIDLHGLPSKDALRTFMDAYAEALDGVGNPTGVQLRVVHGYGSTGEGGVIRSRLRGFCRRFEDYLEFTAGEEIDGNRGCTIVSPKKRLPDTHEMLAEDTWDYCKQARSRSKVMGKFRRYGQPLIMQAIRSLEKQGRMKRSNKKGLVVYESH